MTHPTKEANPAGENWPPPAGAVVSYRSEDCWKTGVLKAVRWGLVWRDFILDGGRVIPEAKIQGCPKPQPWREISEIKPAERESWEERLATMASAGQDPREKEQLFRAELNQYLAYTYLRFKRAAQTPADAERHLDDFRERIKEVKRLVTGRLEELIEIRSDSEECESAAHSLGRLKDLERSLDLVSPPSGRRTN